MREGRVMAANIITQQYFQNFRQKSLLQACNAGLSKKTKITIPQPRDNDTEYTVMQNQVISDHEHEISY